MGKQYLYITLLISSLLYSCSPYKHVPKDKYLLNKVTIHSEVNNQGKAELSQYLKQTPNFKSFGIYRFKLSLYNISGSDSTKKINRFVRKIGESPVVYDEDLTNRSSIEIKRYLQNKGYVNASVEWDVNFDKKRAEVTYHVNGGKPYRINNYVLSIKNDTILSILKKDSANSLIKKNMGMDIDVINAERLRINALLRRNGYYNFNRDNLHFIADSTIGNHLVDIRLVVRPTTRIDIDGNTTTSPQKQYRVRNIYFYTSYDPITPSNSQKIDSLSKDKFIFYFQDKMSLKPDILIENCYIEPNSTYNEQNVEKTYTALNMLSAIRYVNIRFREAEGESNILDCIISTSPSKSQSYSIDLEGTNSTGDLGFAGILGYQHKNLLKGSETFRISLRAANEVRMLSDLLKYNSTEVGGEMSVNFPRFLFPLLDSDFKKTIKASTELNVSYNYQQRVEYARTIASGGMKYLWSKKKTTRHSIDLLDISYIYLPYISDDFKEEFLNNSSILKYSYEDHLIVRSGYAFSYGNQSQKKQQNNIIIRGGVESAGNTLYALYSLIDAEKTENSYTFGNIKFAQYLKGDLSFSYDKYIDKRNNFVYHIGLGMAYPYGNVNVLPFEKRYVSGGANSVRGWSVRSLGPGIYKGSSSIDYMNQSGDIKLDLNLEYRFKMFWVMQGALFADAGNIWTLKYYNTQEGGEFKLDEFYKQLAASYGFGVRFDFTYFLFRIDMGIKAFNPSLEKSEQWRFKPLNWDDDFAFHFAVGYPF